MGSEDQRGVQSWSADVVRLYEDAARRADLESLHECLVRYGPTLLERGLPYALVAARSRLRDRARRDRRDIFDRDEFETAASSWQDPFERLCTDRQFAALLEALATLPVEDALSVWRHAEGHSDDQIAHELNALRERSPLSGAAVRKKRSRTLVRLRRVMEGR